MQAASGEGVTGRGASLRRLLWVGPLTIAAAVVVNVVIRAVAVGVLGIGEGFLPLGLGPTVVFTVVGVAGAVVVFALVLWFSQGPVRLFRRVAAVALVLSLIPNVLLMVVPSIPATTVPAVVVLMVEHVAAWAVAVGAFAAFFREG